MLIQDWLDVLRSSLMDMLDRVIGFIPSLFGAIILLIVGIIVAKSFEFSIEKIVSAMKIDTVLKKAGLDRYTQRAGIKLDSGRFLGKIAYWIILIIFAIGVADLLGIPALAIFITSVLGWIFMHLVVAILILLITALIAQVMQKLVSASVLGAKLHKAKFLGIVTWWIVMIFGSIMAINQLGIDTGLLESVLMSIITTIPLALGLALGLAFGLGGKKHAEQVLERLEEKLENH